MKLYWLVAGALPLFARCTPAEIEARPRDADNAVVLQPTETSRATNEGQSERGEPESMRGMLEFFGIGRGERIADLGAGAGYSIEQMVDAVGPAGRVYARHDPRTLVADATQSASAEPAGTLAANLVVMDTSDAAPFSAEAKDLDLVTMLFSYHELVALGHDRLAFNRAVLDALAPDRLYIIAERAAPDGAGVGAAKEGRLEERIVRADVEAAGFTFVEAAQLLPSASQQAAAVKVAAPSQYLLKFRRPK